MYGFLGALALILLLLPWITSFRFVRKKMKEAVWKKLHSEERFIDDMLPDGV
jgi:DMSO/TMAO reductase YedYZ heme-binding membrane subunit